MSKLAWVLLAIIGVGVVVGSWALLQMPNSPLQTPGQNEGETSEVSENPVPASGKQTYHLEVDGVEREFIVYRPESLESTEEVPVVFMFHGSGQSGEYFYRESGWTDKADEEGFMVVFPTGLKYHIYSDEKIKKGKLVEDVKEYQTKWNTYGLQNQLDPAYPDQELADDIAFTEAMVDFVQEGYATDEARFYATGFSNGGGFTSRLAIEMTDVFAAFAPTGSGPLMGVQFLDELESAMGDEFTPRPVMQMIGSADAKLTYSAGVEEFTTDESAADEDDFIRQTYMDSTLEAWGLTDEYTYEQQGRVSHFEFATPEDDDSEAEYHLLIVDNMQHIYPNGSNIPLDVANIYWSFFEQHSL